MLQGTTQMVRHIIAALPEAVEQQLPPMEIKLLNLRQDSRRRPARTDLVEHLAHIAQSQRPGQARDRQSHDLERRTIGNERIG